MKSRIYIIEDEIHMHPRNAILKALDGCDLTIALSTDEGKKNFDPKANYDLVIIDHDMYGWPDPNYHPNSGYAFLEWLTNQAFKLPKNFVLHTWNYDWRDKQVTLLKKVGITPSLMPFGDEYVRWLANRGWTKGVSRGSR